MLDALGIDRFATVGLVRRRSACARVRRAPPGRCAAAVSISGVAPYLPDEFDWTAGMAAENVHEFAMTSRPAPPMTSCSRRYRAFLLAPTPTAVTSPRDLFGDLVSERDAAATTPEALAFLLENFSTALAPGYGGWRDDDQAFVKPWGFDVASIDVPVAIWFGDHDLWCRRATASGSAANVSGARAPPARPRRDTSRSWSNGSATCSTICGRWRGPVVRIGNLYGPDATFLGVPGRRPRGRGELGRRRGGHPRRPVRRRHVAPRGCRFGPYAIRTTDYLPHDGSRPHLALGVDPLDELHVVDVGDVEMPSGDTERSLRALEDAVATIAGAGKLPVVLGGDHTIALPDVTGVARHVGFGEVSVVHFDAHADTGRHPVRLLHGHGTPMRRLIESGACRGDRFIQIGLRGYWPDPRRWRGWRTSSMRSYEMTEITQRGLDAVLDEAFALATDECEAVFLSVDVDVVDPGHAPGTGTPEPGGLTSRQLLDAVRRCAIELPVAGIDVVEVSPPYDHAEVTAYLANRVVLEALSGIAWRRRRERGATHRDPSSPLLDGR